MPSPDLYNPGQSPTAVVLRNPVTGEDYSASGGTASNPSFAKGATYTPLGHQQLASAAIAGSTALPSVPATATVALIQNNGTTPARIVYTGTATATTGLRITAGTTLTWDVGQAALTTSRVIREADGAILDILYLA